MATKTVFVTSGTTWTLPSDLDTAVNITGLVIGGGAAGRAGPATNTGATGGGGGASAPINLSLSGLTPGTSTVFIQIGAGGTSGTNNATDTWINKAANSAPAVSTNGSLAKAGQLGTTDTTGGVGGAAASCVPSTGAFSGGNGGARSTTGTATAGGGAGGTTAAGSSVAADGVVGGAGGAASGGTGGATAGGAGGAGSAYTATAGGTAGAGGGGGGRTTNGVGGQGGLYGGGGGGGRTTGNAGGAGRQGVIIIVYTVVRTVRHFRYNPADFTKMWQDSAKTIAVTGVGDPVGYIACSLGSGIDVSQATSGKRPIVRHDGSRYYLEIDGTDDYLENTTVTLNLDEFVFFVHAQETTEVANAGLLSIKPSGADDYATNDGLTIDTGTSARHLEAGGTVGSTFFVTIDGTGPTPKATWEIYKTATTGVGLKDGTSLFTDSSFGGFLSMSGGGFYVGARYYASTVQSPWFAGRIYSYEFDGTASISSTVRDAVRAAHTSGEFGGSASFLPYQRPHRVFWA